MDEGEGDVGEFSIIQVANFAQLVVHVYQTHGAQVLEGLVF